MLNGWLSLGHSDAKKTMNMPFVKCLYTLTHMIFRPLAFWVGVMRSIITHLMKLVGGKVHKSRNNYVFMRNYFTWLRVLNNEFMFETDVNVHIQRSSPDFPVRLICTLL